MTPPGGGALLVMADGSRRAAAACSAVELAEAAALLAVEVLGPRWLAAAFDELNAEVFGGTLPRPVLRLCALPVEVFGQYELISGVDHVRVNHGLLSGHHPDVRSGPRFAAGRLRVASDVVLHESTHLWAARVAGVPEVERGGHGSVFARKAAAIGRQMGLPPVRGGLEEYATWPVAQCPADRYAGALVAAG